MSTQAPSRAGNLFSAEKVSRYAVVLAFLGLLVAFSLASPTFFKGANLYNVLLNNVVMLAIVALGMTIVITAGGIDLSVGVSVDMASMVFIMLLAAGYGAFFGVAVGLCAAAAVGLLNAILITRLKISPFLARRLACEAGIIPVVLDGDSQPLDVGRKKRRFTEAQRVAMLVRDRGCRADGCDRTVGLHAHHRTRWADGGHTNLRDGVSLCHWHHNRAHDPAYETTYHPNGDVTFHRRT